VPGPFTMSQQAQNDFYKDEGEMALDYAAAVNAEIKDLSAAVIHVRPSGYSFLPEFANSPVK
jgi:methionine synthase II (cobalamin-independent)